RSAGFVAGRCAAAGHRALTLAGTRHGRPGGEPSQAPVAAARTGSDQRAPQPAVVALGADAAGGPGADRRRLVGRRAGAARLLHRRRRDPRAVLDLSGTPGAGRRAPRLVRARPLRLASVHTTIVRAPLTSHRRRMRRLAALRTHLAVDTARRHRAGAQPLERNLDAAIHARAVGAFVVPTQRRAQPAPFVDVAQCLRHLDFAFVQDRPQVAAVTDAVERGKLLRSLAELAGNLFFEHDQALTNL